MSRNIVIFEDAGYEDLYPLTLLRPSYFLRSGARPLYRKYADLFHEYTPFLFCRPSIEDIIKSETDIAVNSFNGRHAEETILINGRLKPDAKFIEALKLANSNVVILSNAEEVAAVKTAGKLSDDQFQDLMNGDLPSFVNKAINNYEKMKIDIGFYCFLWDFVNDIHKSITNDFTYFKENMKLGFKTPDQSEYLGCALINSANILVNSDVELMPGTVIDASDGPVIIDKNVRIEPNTYVIGPSYIGPDSILVGGKIDACSIGPVCRIGGEFEESIAQGYTNKYHAGFIGHSYVGEWVNFGAMTTNSDLKNNYKNIFVTVNGRSIDTGTIKAGSYIGDYTRTAIGTLLNTGINIGVSCNILGGSLVTEREIGSFTWLSPDGSTDYKYEKALETIETAVSRRNISLSDALRKRLKDLSKGKP